MMITTQMLSIPPYISTTWKNITSLHSIPDGQKFKLIVILNNGIQTVVPSLDQTQIDSIFEAHARYESTKAQTNQLSPSFKFPLTNQTELFNTAMQHNPDQSDSPELPKEILEKITSIAKVLGLEDVSQLPKPEPQCNCMFCQIARAFHGEESDAKTEEIVSDKDLEFRTWDIKQTSEKLYHVTNPLDDKEQYSVYLGEPIGCTCGQKNCEHIRAVLNS
jgi:hypothetical protein